MSRLCFCKNNLTLFNANSKKRKTVSFYQEIYNEKDELVEVHYKFPIDKGHYKINRK